MSAPRYQVITLVHSPASVGASSSPTSAFSSVDFPAFSLPAMASRNGSSIRTRAAFNCGGVPLSVGRVGRSAQQGVHRRP